MPLCQNKDEAEKKAKELIPIAKANSTEVIAAHVKQAKGLAKQKQQLDLNMTWEKYAAHPAGTTGSQELFTEYNKMGYDLINIGADVHTINAYGENLSGRMKANIS